MLDKRFDNKTVDAIGRKLVENDLLSVDEIDRIISKPDIFEQVNRRIAATQDTPAVVAGRRSTGWIPAAAGSFAVLAILAVLATGLIDRDVGLPQTRITYIQVPDAAPESARPDVPLNPLFQKHLGGRALISENQGPRIEKLLLGARPRVRMSGRAPCRANRKPNFIRGLYW